MNWLFYLIMSIILLSFIAIIVIVSINKTNAYKITTNNDCQSDDECPSNQYCTFDADYNTNICTDIGTQTCNVSANESDLTVCDINSNCSTCINQPPFQCIVVSDDTPYTYIKDGETTQIPNSPEGQGWCLPPMIQGETCNTFTSDAILYEKTDINNNPYYEWVCQCKYPNFITHDQPGSNCNDVLACDPGELYIINADNNPAVICDENNPCSKGGICIDGQCTCTSSSNCVESTCVNGVCRKTCSKDTDCKGGNGYCYKNQCYQRWLDDQNTDPVDGICKCPSGTIYKNEGSSSAPIKTCVTDPCYPNGIQDENGNCQCNTGYISCGDLPSQYQSLCKSQCIDDPCKPNGVYDSSTGTCKCTGNYTSIKDENLQLGVGCKDICGNGKNWKCGDGNTRRGTCQNFTDNGYNIYNSQYGSGVYCDCNSAWTNFYTSCKSPNGGDDDNMCGGYNKCYKGVCQDILCSQPVMNPLPHQLKDGKQSCIIDSDCSFEKTGKYQYCCTADQDCAIKAGLKGKCVSAYWSPGQYITNDIEKNRSSNETKSC